MNAGCAVIEWAGETLTLLPERAIWWERERTLFIADPHFGKAATFRFSGIPVPETSHEDDLARLDGVLARLEARQLVILGDFFHAKCGRNESTLGSLAKWRARCSTLEIVLVLGNHDRHAGSPPMDWRIECVNGPWGFGPFHCRHEPEAAEAAFVLAGHIHPSCGLPDRIGSGLRGPCFHFGNRVAVLPAFGSFTGSQPVRPARGERIFLVGPDSVMEITRAIRRD